MCTVMGGKANQSGSFYPVAGIKNIEQGKILHHNERMKTLFYSALLLASQYTSSHPLIYKSKHGISPADRQPARQLLIPAHITAVAKTPRVAPSTTRRTNYLNPHQNLKTSQQSHPENTKKPQPSETPKPQPSKQAENNTAKNTGPLLPRQIGAKCQTPPPGTALWN